jgi:hypothetical protein
LLSCQLRAPVVLQIPSQSAEWPRSHLASSLTMDFESVRAHVKARLAPHFAGEEDLLVYLLQQPPGDRADKLAARCQVQLGTAALYVQHVCAPGACSQVCASQRHRWSAADAKRKHSASHGAWYLLRPYAVRLIIQRMLEGRNTKTLLLDISVWRVT